MNAPIRPRKFIPEPEEFAEWQYRYHERLGILCGTAIPTLEQEAIARAEADAWLEAQPLKSCLDAFDNPKVEPVIKKQLTRSVRGVESAA